MRPIPESYVGQEEELGDSLEALQLRLQTNYDSTKVANEKFPEGRLISIDKSHETHPEPHVKSNNINDYPQTSDLKLLEKTKRVNFGCEICGREPKLMCSGCNETYYCCTKHCNLDFHAIHKYVCIKIKVIRNPDCKNDVWKRFTAEEIRSIQNARKQIVLKVALNMAYRHLHRGNYLFAIPCSLLSQKLTVDQFGDLYCPEMVGPYLTIASAYLARRKLDKSRFYSGLVNHIKTEKLCGTLPKNKESELQIITARQCMEEQDFAKAMIILTIQVAELAMEYGQDSQELLDPLFYLGYCCFNSHNIISANAYYCYFLDILSKVLVNDLANGSPFLHQSIEEQLNPLIKPGMRMAEDQRSGTSQQSAPPYSEKRYQVYLRRECLLTYLRTIWKQFEMANKGDFPEIFPLIHYCIAITLYACNQWTEASDYYREAERLKGFERTVEFQNICKLLNFLQKHVDYCLNKREVTTVKEPDRPSEKAPTFVQAATSAAPVPDDELGETLKLLAARIRLYETEIAQMHGAEQNNSRDHLHRLGIL